MPTITLSDKEYRALVSIMQEQISSPARAMVNGESAFVASKLSKLGFDSLSVAYWSWACMHKHTDPLLFGEEVAGLQDQLDAIDKSTSIPEWGTRGT